jgi:hypothetical protein
MQGPRIVTLLLDMAQRRVPGALERLAKCLTVTDARVRTFGALALSAFDRPRAVEQLAIEINRSQGYSRLQPAAFLLQLGDGLGIPPQLQALAANDEFTRDLACANLRAYTQQTLPCDARVSVSQRNLNMSAWQAWWTEAAPLFRVKTREAELDFRIFPLFQIAGRPLR